MANIPSDIIGVIFDFMESAAGMALVCRAWWEVFTHSVEYRAQKEDRILLAAGADPRYCRFFTTYEIYVSGNVEMMKEKSGSDPEDFILNYEWLINNPRKVGSRAEEMAKWILSVCTPECLSDLTYVFIPSSDKYIMSSIIKSGNCDPLHDICMVIDEDDLSLFRLMEEEGLMDTLDYIMERAVESQSTSIITYCSYRGMELLQIPALDLNVVRALSPAVIIKNRKEILEAASEDAATYVHCLLRSDFE